MNSEPASAFEIALDKTPAPIPSDPMELQVLHALEDAGATFRDVPRAMRALETAFDLIGDQRAAEALATIFARLPGGRRGAELRAALLGSVDADGAEQARKFCTSKQAWHQRVTRLRTRLLKKR